MLEDECKFIEMGKARKNMKYAVKDSEKMALDEQITSGRVVRTKNKVKIRMRAEEDEVSGQCGISKEVADFICSLLFSTWTPVPPAKFCTRLVPSKLK